MKISIWLFDDAPQRYQDMSRHGGDENYIVVFHQFAQSSEYQDRMPSPLYQLLPGHWDNPAEPRDYESHWGFVQRMCDGDDLIVITAHA